MSKLIGRCKKIATKVYRRFSATEYYVKEASYKKIYSITLNKK